MESSQPPPPAEKGLEQDLKKTVDLVKKEVSTTLSGMEKLPIHLLLILLGSGLSVLLGLLFFAFQLGGRHWYNAIINLAVCIIFGASLRLSFILTKRRTLFGGALAGIFSLILIVAGGTGGLIGGIVGLGGAGIIFLKEFGILAK